MTKKYIYVNPGHGNEPFILGFLVAQGVAEKYADRTGVKPSIIMPLVYGDTQKRILSEINDGSKIVYEPEAAEFYNKLMFRDGLYATHLNSMLSERSMAELGLNTTIGRNFGKNNILAEINITSRFTVHGIPSYYIFPALFSEILERAAIEKNLKDSLGEGIVYQSLEVARLFEREFQLVFIPAYNTFSFDRGRKPKKNEITTPIPKPKPAKNTGEIPENSAYVMMSGTGAAADKLLLTARELRAAGNNVILPPWYNQMEFPMAGPEIISNDNIGAVYGRAGWGTIWTCQLTNKPFVPLEFESGDDPEIYFNIRTLREVPISEGNRLTDELFGPNADGIDFISQRIVDALPR